MGLKKATVKLGADISQFTSKMKKASRSFKRMGASMKRVGKTMSMSLTLPLVAFAAASVKAFDTQAKAEAKLLTALKGNEAAFKSLKKQAQELQKITIFGDEQTIAAQSMLATMGLEEEAIKRLIPLIQDMATAKGMDLVAAADLVAKSVGSSTNALSRYGITIEGAVGSSERLDSAVNALSGQFLGQSEAAAKAGAGGLTQLKNSFGDLMETVGQMLMPVLTKLMDKIKIGVEALQKLSTEQIKSKLKWLAIAAAIGPVLIVMGKLFTAASLLTKVNPWYALAAGIAAAALKLRNDFKPAVDEAFLATRRIEIGTSVSRKARGGVFDAASGSKDIAKITSAMKVMEANIDEYAKLLGDKVNKTKDQLGLYVDKVNKAVYSQLVSQLASLQIQQNNLLKSVEDYPEPPSDYVNFFEDLAAVGSENDFSWIDDISDQINNLPTDLIDIEDDEEDADDIDWEAVNKYSDALELIKERTTALKELTVQFIDQFANGFVNLFDKVTDADGAIVKFGEKFKQFAADFLIQIAKMIAQAAIFAGLTSLFGLSKGVGFMSLFLGKLTGKAHGGPVAGNTPYIVGENGPELFMSNSAGTIIPNNQLGGSQTIIPDVRITGSDLLLVFNKTQKEEGGVNA